MSSLLTFMLGLGSACFDLIDSICKPVATMLFTAIDTVDSVFRRLAGIKSTADVQAGTKDFVDQLIDSPTVKNIMISLMLFGVCVLVLTVILSIIRNVYKDDSKVTISSIFGQAIKAVIGFILIPALCLVGVKFSNVILQAIDGATQAGGQVSSSFTYGIYNACMEDDDSESNPYKIYAEDPALHIDNQEYINNQRALMVLCQYLNKKFVNAGYVSNVIEDDNIDTYGEIQAFYAHMTTAIFNNFPDIRIEDASAFWIELEGSVGGFLGIGATTIYFEQKHEKNPNGFTYVLPDENGEEKELTTDELRSCRVIIADMFHWYTERENNTATVTVKTLDNSWRIKKRNSVWSCDNLLKTFKVNEDLNYFNALLASILIFMALWKLCFGMAKRIVQVILLYILSPIALAMYPWDNGSAFGSWKKDFVGYTIGAYGAIAAMNLTVQLMPIITGLDIMPERPLINSFAKLVMYIVLAQGMASLVSTLSTWIGGKDLLKEGGDTAKQVTDPIMKVGGVALGAAAMGAGIGMAGFRHLKAVQGAGKSAFNSGKESFLGGKQAEAEETMRNRLSFKSDGTERSTSELAKGFNMSKFKGESDAHFADRVNQEKENRIAQAGQNARLSNEATAENFALDQASAAEKQARKDLKGTGGWATAGRAASKLGLSTLGLLGSSSGVDLQKTWSENYKGVGPDYEKAAKGSGIGLTGKGADNATAIINANIAGAMGASLIGNTSIAASIGADAQAASKILAQTMQLELNRLTSVLGKKYDSEAKVKLLLENEAELKKLSKPKQDALSQYIRNTQGIAQQQAVLQNTIDATVSINTGFADADKGKVTELMRKGTADGFKDAKAYLIKEVQASVEKSGKKWTGDMASEIEKQLDKYFKKNYKPNKD